MEEYHSGHYMKLAYWREGASKQLLSSFLLHQSQSEYHHVTCLAACVQSDRSIPTGSSPKVTISVDPAKDGNPFTTTHTPPLHQGSKVTVSAGNLSLESLLDDCISVRSHTVLSGLKDTLGDTSWEKHGRELALVVM